MARIQFLFLSIALSQCNTFFQCPADAKPITDSKLFCDSNVLRSGASVSSNSNSNSNSNSKGMELARALATQMAPCLVMSPGEGKQCCYPGDALSHLKTKVKQIEVHGSTFVTAGSKTKALYQKTFEQVPCYCELYFDPPYVQVKYWFWWTFNDHPLDTSLNLFDHEGDWEHIELRARIVSENQFKYMYYFNRHGDAFATIPSYWESSENGIKQHPIVWIAKGSHAPYDKPNIHEKNPLVLLSKINAPSLSRLADLVSDSKMRWKTYEHLIFKHDDPNAAVWTYKGKWGADSLTPTIPLTRKRLADAPTGPAARERFSNSGGKEVFP
mgnify:CR=1 FL=1